jgi:hypothetical protein
MSDEKKALEQSIAKMKEARQKLVQVYETARTETEAKLKETGSKPA